MGLIMEEKCNIELIKCEPVEVIVVDEISQDSVSEQTQAAVKQEPENGAARLIEVKSEFQGLTDWKPTVITVKEEHAKLRHDNVITLKNKWIKFEPFKGEEIEITVEDSSDEEQDAINPHTCNIGGYKTALKDTLSSHVSLHIGEKRYKCNECDYSTSLQDIFRTHMLNHPGWKRYECDICEFTTARRDNLNEHILKHTGEKPHKCKTIKQIREKPFKCNKCEYGGDTRTALKKHMLITHSGKKLLECHRCSHKTPSKSHLRQHIRTHLENRVKSYKCNACKNRFLYKSSLLKHMSKRPCKPGHS